MTREEALRIADQMVSEWTEQVKNQRGYVHDKWSPVDLEARTKATLELARYLLTPQPVTRLQAPVVPVPTLYGWAIDGSGGKPTDGQYRMAQETLARMRTTHQLVKQDEVYALQALIAACDEPGGAQVAV